jgi:hemin uptake protein HemP
MDRRNQAPRAPGDATAASGEAPSEPKARRPLHSTELFGGVNEVEIEHQGELYRLRRTSKGKLILTK